jgi:RimJ/RimL family protein N-acetyltransferase
MRAMIDERIRNYNVGRLVAVAKAANFRSIRTLARLGFSPATAEAQPTHRVKPDEVLMFRAVKTA